MLTISYVYGSRKEIARARDCVSGRPGQADGYILARITANNKARYLTHDFLASMTLLSGEKLENLPIYTVVCLNVVC